MIWGGVRERWDGMRRDGGRVRKGVGWGEGEMGGVREQ